MTDTRHDTGYEPFLEEFGRQLGEAACRPARQGRRSRAVACVCLLAALGAGVIAALGSAGKGGVGIVAQAEAALAPAGQLVRIIAVSHLEMRGGTSTELTGAEAESLGWNKPHTAEQWSASSPTRWRIATTIPTSSVAAAPLQCAYSNGSEETYNQGSSGNEVVVVPVSRGQDEGGEESSCTTQASGGLGTQVVAHIHAMLEAGQLRAVGKTTVDGREALRLIGQETPVRPQGTGPGVAWPVEYAVDPGTYAPMRFTIEMPGVNSFGNAGTLTEVTDVTVYEQVPLNEATAGLLRIKTTGTPVIRHAPNEYETRLAGQPPHG